MKVSFNLLKSQFEPPTVWTKLYDWVVGSARLIMIGVQVIVAIAFAIRVVVDVQSKNLTDKIEQQEKILAVFAPDEAKYRIIQNKTSAVRIGLEDATKYNDVLKDINAVIPKNAIDISVQINEDVIYISGGAPASEVDTLENFLDNSDKFKNTQLLELITSGASSASIARFSLKTQRVEVTKRAIPTPTLF